MIHLIFVKMEFRGLLDFERFWN